MHYILYGWISKYYTLTFFLLNKMMASSISVVSGLQVKNCYSGAGLASFVHVTTPDKSVNILFGGCLLFGCLIYRTSFLYFFLFM